MNALKRFCTGATRLLASCHCGWLVFLTLACLVFKEEYPFSSFPMYSSFSRKTSYVYLADGNDKPLPTINAAAMSSSKLKKVFQSELDRARRKKSESLTTEEKRTIGENLLKKLQIAAAKRTPDQWPQVWRLYEVQIELTDGRLEKTPKLVAQSP